MHNNTVESSASHAEYRPDIHAIWLYVPPHGNVYEIDLDRCTTAKQALDWIFHVAKKPWCSGDMLQAFIRCLQQSCRDRAGVSASEYFGVRGKLASNTRK